VNIKRKGGESYEGWKVGEKELKWKNGTFVIIYSGWRFLFFFLFSFLFIFFCGVPVYIQIKLNLP